jgi:hypothetical protein
MKLPDGWNATMPAAVHAKCAYGTCTLYFLGSQVAMEASKNGN